MRLGIFGGTFDPIHMGHLLITELARSALQLDRVLFVPAGDPPHKQGVAKTAAGHRQKMVELATANNPHFELCPVDLERSGPHYSVDTVRLIQSQYGGIAADDSFFIIGGDSLTDLPTWHRPQELIRLCRLAVVHRPGYQPNLVTLERVIPGVVARIEWVSAEAAFDLSSVAIRTRVAGGQSIRYQVPEPVWTYIQQHKLYLEREDSVI